MSTARPWPALRPQDRWALELMEECFERTSQTPDELSARAAALRAQAAATDIEGVRDASFALADRYEEVATSRLAST